MQTRGDRTLTQSPLLCTHKSKIKTRRAGNWTGNKMRVHLTEENKDNRDRDRGSLIKVLNN